MRRQGFTIIETVIYLSLFTILFFILHMVVLEVQKYSLFLNNFNEQFLRKNIFFDVAMRDLISRDINKPYVRNKNIYIFTKNDKEVGFVVRDEKIFRIEGKYDFTNKKWLKKYSSLAFSGKKLAIDKLYIRSRNGKK